MPFRFHIPARNKKLPAFLRIFWPVVLGFALLLAGCAGKKPEPAPVLPPVVIFAGDSIMEGLGPELERALRSRLDSEQIRGERPFFVQAGVSSSGLCRPDFYDWPAKIGELMANARSGCVIICIGTNDDQAVTGEDGKKRAFGTAAWAGAYSYRVGEIIGLIANAGARQIWLSPPVMREPLGSRVKEIKKVIAKTCARHNVPYLDIWQNLADANGEFQRHLLQADGTEIAIRTRDGVHLTRAGNQELASQLVPILVRTMQQK